jgi:hypothetical protein
MTTLREFKAKQIAMLMLKRIYLKGAYPDRQERVDEVIDILISKLQNLRAYTLTDYLSTLYRAMREFEGLEDLAPDVKEVEELLRNNE